MLRDTAPYCGSSPTDASMVFTPMSYSPLRGSSSQRTRALCRAARERPCSMRSPPMRFSHPPRISPPMTILFSIFLFYFCTHKMRSDAPRSHTPNGVGCSFARPSPPPLNNQNVSAATTVMTASWRHAAEVPPHSHRILARFRTIPRDSHRATCDDRSMGRMQRSRACSTLTT